ncbi:hypothetical protein PhCBS80983_g02901 [Powellomyces hirtus]|uniref:dolichyl-phosphate beta-glucosyltransferase n=1 Tax=Powellomyces hirtus TaxID=109895 RepID=A0A507E665_9FUNG|nr:hypothetical protein PhCBS80983_g02901 [Powellomyces hirtus]
MTVATSTPGESLTSLLSLQPTSPTAILALLTTIFILTLTTVFLTLNVISPCPRAPTANELHFTDAKTGQRRRFPRLANSRNADAQEEVGDDDDDDTDDASPVSLSIIIPAYNETTRLPTMLSETRSYLDARAQLSPSFSYEIIIVDDGSRDGTSTVAFTLAHQHATAKTMAIPWDRREIRIMTLETNRGKGGAVTQGMLVARGEWMLFADADGATRFSDVELLEDRLRKVRDTEGRAVVVGSRAHMVSTEAVVKRSFIRNLLMHGFHALLLLLGISSIHDTQCGFKLLSRPAAHRIFPSMHAEGWIFDIELLLIAIKLAIPVAEVPVTWHEVEGTKMNLVTDSLVMLKDLLVIRANYWMGRWTVR